jgi:hypothetical protein
MRLPHRDAEKHDSLEVARAALGDAAFEAAWSTGRTWALDEAVDRSLATDTVQVVTA